MGFLTGKSKSKSTQQSQQQSQQQSSAGNIAHDYLQKEYAPTVQQGNRGFGLLGSLLGLDGGEAGDAAYGRFKESTGYETAFNDGQRAVQGAGSGRGVFNSGATAKALQARGQETSKSSFMSFLQSLLGFSNQGMQAGNLIGSTGGVSNSSGTSSGTSTGTSTSSSKPGLGPTLGAAMSMIPSDPRLKTDIDMVGTAENGLGIYQYRYIWDDEGVVRTGYMADEVAELAPHALGPKLPGGYMTVDYSKLPEIV